MLNRNDSVKGKTTRQGNMQSSNNPNQGYTDSIRPTLVEFNGRNQIPKTNSVLFEDASVSDSVMRSELPYISNLLFTLRLKK